MNRLPAGAAVARSVLALVLITMAATGCRTRPGNDNPDLRLLGSEDLKNTLHELREPLTLVHVWATWCAPCREEFPVLMRFRNEYSARGVSVILVSADPPAQRDAVVQYLAGMRVLSPSYIIDNPNEAFINSLCAEWSGALPASFFFRPGGGLQQWWEGKAEYDRYQKVAEELLKQTNERR